MHQVVYERLVDLCEDICRRNGKKKLLWFGDKNKSLNYQPKADEMIITVHRWFANKSCPGDWLYARLGDLAAKVTSRFGSGNVEVIPSGMQAGKFQGLTKEQVLAVYRRSEKIRDSCFDAYGPVYSGERLWKERACVGSQ